MLLNPNFSQVTVSNLASAKVTGSSFGAPHAVRHNSEVDIKSIAINRPAIRRYTAKCFDDLVLFTLFTSKYVVFINSLFINPAEIFLSVVGTTHTQPPWDLFRAFE